MGSSPVEDNQMNDLLPQELFEHIRGVYRKTVADLMRRRNVVALGIGFKQAGRQPTPLPGLIVSVERKEPISQLAPADIIPQSIEDVPTDVVETGPILALGAYGVNRRASVRPARPGASVGHTQGSVGTIGAIVQRSGQYFILSNNHVLALLNEAKRGDLILQPGAGDGGTAGDQIAMLEEWVPLVFSEQGQGGGGMPTSQAAGTAISRFFEGLWRLLGGANPPGERGSTGTRTPLDPHLNTVDVALARVSDVTLIDPSIMDIGGPPRGTVKPRLGMQVVKSGRTSQLTQSVIRQVNVTVDVKYGQRRARFANQIMADPFSGPGDSGSLVLDYERNAVGLLFSGSEQVSVINPIEVVLEALKVRLVMAAIE